MSSPPVSTTLVSILTGLANWAENQHKYIKGESFTPTWALSAGVDIVDPTQTGTVFKDSTFDTNLLLQQHQNRNPYWQAMLVNLQINALSTLERSFRSRHMSPVRALYATAGRHMGQESLIKQDIGA
jgi:hypothetical protein